MFLWKKKDSVEKMPYKREVEKIHESHKTIQHMSQDELKKYTETIRNESDKDKQKIEAYAVAYEVIKRTLNVEPYDVQLAGGYALTEGNISQMRTGEGKTITAILPAVWGYIAKLQSYVITVNEYLSERDYLQAKMVFDYLDVEIGLVLNDMKPFEKKLEYAKPVVYVTNSEFAFDYLRDNIAGHPSEFMQGSFDFAIIDEADLVLIDEAKNPVIISNSSSDRIPNMLKAKAFVLSLKENEYEIDDEIFIPYLTEDGYDKAKEYFGYELTDSHEMFHAVRQSLIAYHKFKIDVDYIVRDGEVLIVDKFTGRVLSGRRFQQGLHQAIEAKEDVEIQPENVAVAMVTYQNLLRKFARLSGMTGTGIESKKEFEEIYRMDVKVIPTNKPVARIDHADIMFQTKEAKYQHLQEIVKEKHAKGQPILIGTISVKESEEVSEVLSKANLPFELLNAKNDKQEAEIIEKAGFKGAITIATNMAGRGTDIKVPEDVEALGGLFVLGVSRNESKRIDRQLQGRSGRQGQAGESQFLTSIEDEFLVMYPTNKFEKFAKKNKEFPIQKENVSKMIDEIQLVMDSQSQSVRKFQFQMDEILQYQREYVYSMRKDILINGLSMEKVKDKIKELSDAIVNPYQNDSNALSDWNMDGINKVLKEKLSITIPLSKEQINTMKDKEYKALIEAEVLSVLENAIDKVDINVLTDTMKASAISVIDRKWTLYLASVEEYKQGFGMTAMGEQDPIRKFSMDMDELFKGILSEGYEDFFSQAIKQIDVLITVNTHAFFTVFPMKDTYMFKFNTKSEEEEEVTSVLYSERGIVETFKLRAEKYAIMVIPYMLNPGKYVIKSFVNGEEINRIGFKVIAEKVENITENTPSITFRLPIQEIHEVSDTVYRGTLLHVISKYVFEFELSKDNEWINIERPEHINWLLGRYVFTLSGANLPLYHREYMVLPNEVKEVEENNNSTKEAV